MNPKTREEFLTNAVGIGAGALCDPVGGRKRCRFKSSTIKLNVSEGLLSFM